MKRLSPDRLVHPIRRDQIIRTPRIAKSCAAGTGEDWFAMSLF